MIQDILISIHAEKIHIRSEGGSLSLQTGGPNRVRANRMDVKGTAYIFDQINLLSRPLSSIF